MPRVEDLSLEEKVGQVFMFGFPGKTPEDARELISELKVGGIIYFARNLGSVEEVSHLSSTLQEWAMSNPSGIPLFISADQEGGIVSRLTQGISVMPGPMSLAAADGPELVFEVSRASAEQLRWAGINMNLAPCLDVNDNPENPVIGVRSFGSDPRKVAELGSAAVKGFYEGGIIPVGKHFPGHGNTSLDSHLDLPILPHPRSRLDQVELVPFKYAIESGLPAIMSAHIVFQCIDPERPATLSEPVLKGLLREELNFQGLILTDCLEMNAISKFVGTVRGAVEAFKAGCDILLISHTRELQKAAYQALIEAVKTGEISEERLNESCARILRLKEKLGLPNPLPRTAASSQKMSELSRRAHLQSITLVRDEKGLIPLKPELTGTGFPEKSDAQNAEGGILIVASRAQRLLQVEDAPSRKAPDERGPQNEPWTSVDKALRQHQSKESLENYCTTPLGKSLASRGWPRVNSIEEVFMEDPGALEKSLALGKKAGYVIVISQNAKKNQLQAEFIRRLQENLERVILVASRDPYDIHVVPGIGTYLCTYSTRPEAMDALAQVLVGMFRPVGRLPVSQVIEP